MPQANEKTPHPNLKQRILPHSLEAEQTVLGCILIDEDAPIYILSELTSDDFYSPTHRVIFETMRQIALKDMPVDIVTLISSLETAGQTDSAGGISYLNSLSNLVPSAASFRHYTDIVKNNSTLRRLIQAAGRIADKAFTADCKKEALQFSEKEIYDISAKYDRSKLAPAGESLKEAIERMEFLYANPDAYRGIPTGFKRLDKILGGFQKSDLIIVAARPSEGKTSLGMNFIARAAFEAQRKTATGKPDPYRCAVFSLEMPAAQLMKRLLCSRTKISMESVNSGQLSQKEWKKVHAEKTLVDKAHIYIDDSSLSTPVEILSKCRRLQREKGLDLVMIDYLQLMSSGNVGRRIENRQQEVSDITRMLKLAAKELNVPVILLSQMSRDIEKRKGADKMPQMSDLRESGAIEQDADVIIFIHRKYGINDLSVSEEMRDRVQLIIAKHRNGERGSIDVRWRGETVTFEDYDFIPQNEQPAQKAQAVEEPPPEEPPPLEEPVVEKLVRKVKEKIAQPYKLEEDEII